ncbi:22843_t:CDS:2, partial [Racocetra persica]
DYHWDESDEPNSLCCLVAFGDFDGGKLCFPKLKIIVPLCPGQLLLSSFAGLFSVYNDLKTSVERDTKDNVVSGPIWRQNLEDACKLNRQIHLFKPKTEQIQISPQPSDRRRGCIDLSRTRHGLKAEDPLSNS